MYKISGPWEEEPDKVQWEDESTGMPCLIVRNIPGALCGYVGVPPGHDLHGEDYLDLDHATIDVVHGGLTFAGPYRKSNDPSRGICLITEEGDEYNIWWFGFDCGHLYDLIPEYEYTFEAPAAIYRDIGFVRREVERLAKRLAELGNGSAGA